MGTANYYLGLDMGTSSVGWAVTDENYTILRAKGKDLWGIREFEEANGSIERRSKRTSRRRRQREQVRIGLLKSYFAEEIDKVDPNFFARLDNSFYFLEDKDECVRDKYSIFNDKDYTDRDYFNEYPTIFHLRSALINDTARHDVRLVYLAILNMFKHRGHFLAGDLRGDDNFNSRELLWSNYLQLVEEASGFELDSTVDYNSVFGVLGSNNISKTQKKEMLSQLFSVELKEKAKMSYLGILCGLKIKVSDLFPELEENKLQVSITDLEDEDKVSNIKETIGEEYLEFLETAKTIYDEGVLMGIMGDYKYISQARVASYEKHKEDLKKLKTSIRKYCSPNEYDYMFRSENEGSYGAYVKSVNSNGEVSRRRSKSEYRKKDILYKRIRSDLLSYESDQDVNFILAEIEKDTFLPKQLTSANGTIPNQVHVKEMDVILTNASRYLFFLNEKDNSGLSVKERILMLFSFQIPYYIGPVTSRSQDNGGNGWVIRREEGQVLPWNISDKIDVSGTQIEFIKRLVRDCSYLNGYKVLPKKSLIYEKFCVLNEINNIRVAGKPISVKLKKEIYNDLFESGKKVTRKGLEKYLIHNKQVIKSGDQLSGIDITINNALTTYAQFLPIFGEKLKEDKYTDAIERIVFLSTIYGDSKSVLREMLNEEFSDIVDEKMMKRILGFKFKDWGRVSSEFLHMSGCNLETGERISLISAMWETNMNLMQLINSEQYSFKEQIKKLSTTALSTLSEFEYEDLDEMYFSAPVKRMVWQTILVIKEIERVMGNPPKRIFIEMTRSDEEKRRTVSRKNELLELYKKEAKEWIDLIQKSDENGSLRSKKLYLYLKQQGRCMYTGENIDLDRLFDDNLYDIDHIYPRSKVKDDNINNNLVLVKKQVNANKSDVYPVDEPIYRAQKDFWRLLKEKGFINDEKYKRLVCRNPLSEEQLSGFIARQIVETGQGTKGVADILRQLMPETLVVYSKAGNVSDFRKRIGHLKSRSVNEYHHAHDAYLNIVVGNVYYVKFTSNPMNFIRNEYMGKGIHYNLYKMYDWDVIRGKETAWIAPRKDGTLGTVALVKEMLNKNTPLLTRLNYMGHGAISNETLYSADIAKHENYIPVKETDVRLKNVERYGGFTSLNPAYFTFIEYGKKGKRKKCFDVVPLYYSTKIHNDSDLIRFYEEIMGYEDVRVICGVVRKNSLIELDGYSLYITGLDNRKNVEFFNATPMIIGSEYEQYVHEIESSMQKGYLSEKITKCQNVQLYRELCRKHECNIFANSPKPIASILRDGVEKFESLSTEMQVEILARIISITSIGRTNVSLKEIGGPSENGRIRISGNMTNRKSLVLNNTSVTGLFSHKLDLLRE